MKSLHCVYSKNQFADQYTLDLEGFMSPHEFAATINTFNIAAWHYPPPSALTGSIHFYLICLVLIIFNSVFVLIHQTHHLGLVLSLPFSVTIIGTILMYHRRKQRDRFESAMIHLCSCMNATENVRGINFRLTFLTPEQQISVYPSSTYAITIEFDDRYNLLHHFSSSYTISSPPAYNNHTSVPVSPPVYETENLTKPSSIYSPNDKVF